MSAPNNKAVIAENLKYSFLAARTSDALRNRVDESKLTEDDERSLMAASNFLTTLAEGAELVQTGHYTGHNSRESMRAFRLALNPLKQLETLRKHPDLAEYFKWLAEGISPNTIKSKDTDERRVDAAISFFDTLSEFLSRAMSENRRSRTSSRMNPKFRATSV